MRHSIFLMNQNIPSYACVWEAFWEKKTERESSLLRTISLTLGI